MTRPVVPRVSRKLGVGRSLLCGMQSCTGIVGGVCLSGVMRAAPLRIAPNPGSVGLRELVEARAPPEARAAAVWVVPEGYYFVPALAAWHLMRRGGRRQRRAPPPGTA